MSGDHSSRCSGSSSRKRKHHSSDSGSESGANVSSHAAFSSSNETSSKRRHHRHGRRRTLAGVDYDAQKARVATINAQNLALEDDAHRRMTFLLALGSVIALIVTFFIRLNYYSGSHWALSGRYLVLTAVILILIGLFRCYLTHVNGLKLLIQFQETRVDTLKAALAHQEKKIEELNRAVKNGNGRSKDDSNEYCHQSGLP